LIDLEKAALFPKDGRAVIAAGDDLFAVRRKANGTDRRRVPGKHFDALTALNVPKPRGFVGTSGQQKPAVRRKRNIENHTLMPVECFDKSPGLEITQVNRSIAPMTKDDILFIVRMSNGKQSARTGFGIGAG